MGFGQSVFCWLRARTEEAPTTTMQLMMMEPTTIQEMTVARQVAQGYSKVMKMAARRLFQRVDHCVLCGWVGVWVSE
jgi:hypothetical protein